MKNHASSASPHHAAGKRRRSRPRVLRDGQILTAMTVGAVRATTYNEHIMLTETNPIPIRAAYCPGPTNHNGVSRCPAAAIRSSKTIAATVPQLACRLVASLIYQ